MRRNPQTAAFEVETRPGVADRDAEAEEALPLKFDHAAEETGAGDGGAAVPAGRPAPPALLAFTLIASLGGFLFGFDTGVISGALPFIRDDILAGLAADPAAQAQWQEVIVSAAIVAAGGGSVAGGWLADRLGRRAALLVADVLFTAGALAMAAAVDQYWLVLGRALVGLGVGLASVCVPVYLAECAPPPQRAALVTCNVLFITGGQFAAYLADYAFSFVPGTWRWMLGVAALPALAQFAGLLRLPESPKWLAGRGRGAAAQRALQRLQPGLPSSAAAAALGGGEAAAGGGGGDGSGGRGSAWRLLRSPPVLRELHIGVGLQVQQQTAGINTVMYYTPSILQLAGVANQTALLLSLLPAATNALGTVVGMRAIDRHGRRRLLLSSVGAVVVALAALGSAFLAAERHSPAVLPGSRGSGAAGGSTCPTPAADCTACLRAACGFCGGGGGPAGGGGSAGGGSLMAPGTCLALSPQAAAAAGAAAGAAGGCAAPAQLYLQGCPSAYSWLILGCLVLYLAAFSPGLGPVPWAVNAEIYPLEVRGLATGIAATANWVSNALVAQTFLTLARLLGGSGAFFLYAGVAAAGGLWAHRFLPETSGLTLNQVQQLFGGDGGGGRGPGGAQHSSGGGGNGGSSGGSGGSGGGWLWRGWERKRRSSDDGGEGLALAAAGEAADG